MITFPNAKINIGLFVTGKRADGFHNIESIFYPIPRFDALELVKHKSFRFDVSGLEIPGDSTSNLCIKAYDLLRQNHDQIGPIHAHLYKTIPMGAGLGGGSADGAFMINLLNDFFQLQLSQKQRENYAAVLGSDCPFFIENKPKLVTGRGEIMESHALDLSGWYLVLVSPDVHVSTKDAYSGISALPANIDWDSVNAQNVAEWDEMGIRNQFESHVAKRFPEIQNAKSQLLSAGASFASMTGSGSSVFGLFAEHPNFEEPEFYVMQL